MSLPILLSLLSALSTAVARTLTRHVLRYAKARDYLSVNFVVLALLLLPFAPFALHIRLGGEALAALLLASLVDGAANYFYFRAFEVAEVTTASALIALSPLFTLLLSPLMTWFAPLHLGWGDIVGTLLIIVGVVCLNVELHATSAPAGGRGAHSRWAALGIPLVTAALLGGNAYTIKYIFARELMNPYTYYFLRVLLVAGLTHLALRPDLKWVSRPALLAIAGRGLFVVVQWIAMLTALSLGDPPLVKAVSETSPLFVLPLSALLWHEQITACKLAGVLLIIGGLLALTL